MKVIYLFSHLRIYLFVDLFIIHLPINLFTYLFAIFINYFVCLFVEVYASTRTLVHARSLCSTDSLNTYVGQAGMEFLYWVRV